MKTYILLLLFTVSFVQCSTQRFTAEEKALMEKYQMPEFSTHEINKFALEYLQHFDKSISAAEKGDDLTLKILLGQTPQMARKAIRFAHKMTAEDTIKWIEWIGHIANTRFDD